MDHEVRALTHLALASGFRVVPTRCGLQLIPPPGVGGIIHVRTSNSDLRLTPRTRTRIRRALLAAPHRPGGTAASPPPTQLGGSR